MKDYKHVAKSLTKLKREIESSFDRIKTPAAPQRPEKMSFSRIKSFSVSPAKVAVPLTTLAIAAFLFFAFKTKLFSFDNQKKIDGAISFIGNAMIQDEFKNMENPEAMGGSDLAAYSEDDPELRFFFYKVKQGDNISSISKKLGLNMDTLVSLNSMDDAHTIREGMRILVPNRPGILYTVKKGDSMSEISKTYNIESNDILDANDMVAVTVNEGDILFLPGAKLTAKQRAKAFGYLFSKPLRGRFTSGYGVRWHPIYKRRKFHAGIDIAAPYGSFVKAAKEGKVIFAGWKGGYGKTVIIRHQLGYSTTYAHMSRINVKVGQYVRAGQTVGRVGSTGVSTGPHLHFEVKRYGKPSNPLRYSGLGKAQGRWY